MLLLGPSGSGKTTLLRAFAGVLGPYQSGRAAGLLERDGRPAAAEDVALVPQDPIDAFLANDAWTEAFLRLRLAGATRTTAARWADAAMRRMDLVGSARVPLQQLSGGEKRRLAFELALARDPSLLLLDEPIDHLDATWRRRIVARILEETARRLVVVATHDPTPFRRHADQALRLEAPPRAPAAIRPVSRPHHGRPSLRLDHVRVAVAGRTLLRTGLIELGAGIHALAGDNGSGKTTLLRTLFGFHAPTHGTVQVAGRTVSPPQDAAAEAVLLFEQPSRMFFSTTAHQEVAFGLDDPSTVPEALRSFHLDAHAQRSPHVLSGGQKQRLAMAVVAARDRPVVLLDEPTHGLDDEACRDLIRLLDAWRSSRCVLVATHDPRILGRADSVLRIRGGILKPEAAAPEVFASIPA